MKRTTVISLAVFLLTLCTLQSCRQDEMDLEPENINLLKKQNQQKHYLKSAKDTLQAISNLNIDHDGNEIKDPPPKDKDQWKH